MPEMPPAAGAGAPPSPGGTPGSPQAQQPPFGASSATGPTQNKGYEAAALQRLGVCLKQLEQLVPMAGTTSELGKDVLDALRKLSKHVPSGSVTPAAEKNNIQQMMMRNTQGNEQMQALKAAQSGGGAAGAPKAA